MTQLELAIETRSTARHLSFLETGRSRPSPDMVDRLANALCVPSHVHQMMLGAAGLPSLDATPLQSAASDVLKFAAESMALAHSPQPAFVFDDSWTAVFVNPAGCALLGDQHNLLRAVFAERWQNVLTNWEAVAWIAFRRLQASSEGAHDNGLDELLQLAEDSLADSTELDPGIDEHSVSPVFMLVGLEVPTVPVVAQFGSLPATGSLQVELIYATTPAGRERFRHWFAGLEFASVDNARDPLDIDNDNDGL